ncbi:uncharacterized protein LOC122927653 [Bufo gargarizans]|uniref:uncharacterized protein LOC122927653 n=1 Tax=Bufo gargarizans TaxID=30331 RepID=UPI001CF2875F|nr:uncharacterized protein LOC122927653 [Bufo gargarizans]
MCQTLWRRVVPVNPDPEEQGRRKLGVEEKREVINDLPEDAVEHAAVVVVRHEEDFEQFYIDNDLLIQMVEERTLLWDHTDRCHADHHLTRPLWNEICAAIRPNWDNLRERQQGQCRDTIMVRWRSIRDRYKKAFNEELWRPSGSGGTSRHEYRYSAALGFLRRTLEMRRTASSTLEPEVPQEAVPEEQATAGPSHPAPTAGILLGKHSDGKRRLVFECKVTDVVKDHQNFLPSSRLLDAPNSDAFCAVWLEDVFSSVKPE